MLKPAEDLIEYLPILILISVTIALSVFILLLSRILGKPKHILEDTDNTDKLASYECGFDPFDDTRTKFDVRFYLVAILFIIFDLEIMFLIPWAMNLKSIGSTGFYSMMFFLMILTIGFVYEWKKGALEW
ncbi:NADH-quinone oxidoreductase subunit A [Rickettsia endosymbiont of Cardiosporidium cionae]|uniref:NADH-quinone oxidoreductase subunit A n=1 Tax=Rickettsia endosymbiont of Cardiosporidium cionae TaxID=2777155 RepID=UPI001895A519|nr:NADH-quinone oxidoreductase subunit A [Rickettsia endosymbiont of Cardiosporidium cionae]KAF8818986.1 NADH-quinone oxidoreductase subunit A [Rickettsia endosymbiont of Cardiosporidium cionae]